MNTHGMNALSSQRGCDRDCARDIVDIVNGDGGCDLLNDDGSPQAIVEKPENDILVAYITQGVKNR